MYDVQIQYPKDSPEYKELDYRITAGKKAQQDCIDKAKGIVCKPMPKHWYDYRAACDTDDAELNLRVLADRKPYFFIWNYQTLRTTYNTYVHNTSSKCIREFRMTIDELLAIPEEKRTDAQADFIRYYKDRMPVTNNDCVMNRICHRFEREFDGKLAALRESIPFDYSIMKPDIEYNDRRRLAVQKLYEQYSQIQRAKTRASTYVSEEDNAYAKRQLRQYFTAQALAVCNNEEELCAIVLDICYQRENSKAFAWDVCGDVILRTIMKRNNDIISYPVLDPDGEFTFKGKRFTMHQQRSEDYERNYSE